MDRASTRLLGVAAAVGIAAVVLTAMVVGARSHPARVARHATTHRAAAALSPPACALSNLQIAVGPGLVGGEDTGGVITFTNVGAGSCQLQGYPDVIAFDSEGAPLQAGRTPTGSLQEGLPSTGTGSHVTLTSGAVASVVVESPDQAPSGAACPKAAILKVTPPGIRVTPLGSSSFDLMWATFELEGSRTQVFLPMCRGLTVHPFVPGLVGTT